MRKGTDLYVDDVIYMLMMLLVYSGYSVVTTTYQFICGEFSHREKEFTSHLGIIVVLSISVRTRSLLDIL